MAVEALLSHFNRFTHPTGLRKIERYQSRSHPDPGGTVLSITTSEATRGRGFSDQSAAFFNSLTPPTPQPATREIAAVPSRRFDNKRCLHSRHYT